MNNVFLVKSPLQLLNAIEAKHYFRLEDKDCYLLVMGDRKSYLQLMKLVAISRQWPNVTLLNKVGLLAHDPWLQNVDLGEIDKHGDALLRSSVFSIRRLNRLASSIPNVKKIFIGDNNNKFMRHFVNQTKHETTILLDDGTATLEIARQRMQGRSIIKPDKFLKKVKLAAKRLFQGLNDKPVDKAVFFTAYNIDVKSPDQVVVNGFSYLKKSSLTLECSDNVYFLGSPLSEVGLMTERSYMEQLGIVRSLYPVVHFVYVAHRRENKQKLDLIRQLPDVSVVLFEYPVEFQFSMIGPKPHKIASFITSALDNLDIILDESVEIVSYKLIDGSYNNHERIDAIYEHYRTHEGGRLQVRTLSGSVC
ncbi:MAG: hypothetical protein QG652_457 [Pseudomonadota bacterium]|nr:hypothetical protein [Pseudomonadota bacterium]